MKTLGICLFLSSPAWGQVASATLSGMVTDPQSRPVPNVRVTIVREATGISRSTLTDDRGAYVFYVVSPGTYSMAAQFTGFNDYRLTGVAIQLNQRARHDIAL